MKQFEVRLNGVGLSAASWMGPVRQNDENVNVHVLEIRTALVKEE